MNNELSLPYLSSRTLINRTSKKDQVENRSSHIDKTIA
jgi:hypothetical protein